MKITSLTAFFILVSCLSTQAQILEHIYTDNREQAVIFEEDLRFIIDSTGQLTIDDLLTDSALLAVDTRTVQMPDPIYYLWTSVRLTNQGTRFRNEFIVSLLEIDSIWNYTVYDQQIVNQQLTGEGIAIWNKNPSHVKNIIGFHLAPGETKTFFLRFRIRLPTTKRYLHRLFRIQPAASINQFITKSYTWESFYLGFMVLFCLLSIYMYRLFKDHVFLYFGGLMLSFGFYFVTSSRVSDTFFVGYFPYSEYVFLEFAITGIVFCLSLFIIDYLGLRQNYGRYVRWSFAYIIFMEAFAHLAPFFISQNSVATIHNILLLVWIIAYFLPIALFAYRGHPAGKVLFQTTVILFITSGLHVLQLHETKASVGFAFNAFQIGTMIFGAALFYDLFTRIDTIRREKDRFQELDQLKSRFFANISHEFRTPLTLIMGPLNQFREKLPQAEDRKLIGLMQRNAERLLNLINQILDLSKLEAGKMTLEAEKVNFPALLKGIVMSFESLAEQKGVRLHFASEEDELNLWVDREKVAQIFNNLLSNAFKYTAVSQEVTVLLTADEEWVTVLVKDTGKGIPADQLPHIFNRFFQANQTKSDDLQGTGIGLTLVKELVNLHGGTITVKSVEHKRTSFRVRLPRANANFREEKEDSSITSQSVPVFQPKEAVEIGTGMPQLAPGDRLTDNTPIILIVEDHEDVRFYIQQNLRKTYRIIEAVNGQDGIDKAWEYVPDLIISDVMMPEKNGYELCHILKNDERSSHIPLILLTAKAAREEKLHGLSEGADDYLLKPFDPEELQLRVRNLIDSRRRLRKQFGESAELAIIDPNLSAPDQVLLQKIYDTLDEYLDDEQFSVDVLAGAVGMSRRHLNRKLTALTDLSANPFIRNYRLQKALHMLQNQKGNVSEVAMATGFSSTAYFVKCFREKFGQTPGSL